VSALARELEIDRTVLYQWQANSIWRQGLIANGLTYSFGPVFFEEFMDIADERHDRDYK